MKPTKYNLFKEKFLYLGHVVGNNGICQSFSLVQDVEMWPVPQYLNELQAFLGLTNDYKRFVKGFADIARSLHNLTRKGAAFIWKKEQANAFIALKKALTTAPVLAYPLAEGRMILNTDASNYSK